MISGFGGVGIFVCVSSSICFLKFFFGSFFLFFIYSFQDCMFSFYLILLLLLFTLDAYLYLNERKKARLSSWVGAEVRSI